MPCTNLTVISDLLYFPTKLDDLDAVGVISMKTACFCPHRTSLSNNVYVIPVVSQACGRGVRKGCPLTSGWGVRRSTSHPGLVHGS